MDQNNLQVAQLQQAFRELISEGKYVELFNEMYAQNRQGALPLPWVTQAPNPYLVEWASLNPARTEVASRCSRYSSGDRLMAKTGSWKRLGHAS